ncbi:MAG: glycosyltransferase family 39 protein [Chloroflexi bacterium]|nr:glycosyltransferase family 39 protein [Chloroflexota bacterium]
MPVPNCRRSRHRIGWFVFAVLAIHGGLLAFSAAVHSPTYSEVNHLPAGLSHLYLRRFDLSRVNPPLVRMVAAVPVALLSPETDWRRYGHSPAIRDDMDVGQDFLQANGKRSLWFFCVARWACIPFGILGGYFCFRFASELYGVVSGCLALVLWCVCPYILGHASLILPDAPAAAMGIAAYYAFWRWLKRINLKGAVIAGVLLGLAQLAKTTLLVFYPLWLVTWIAYGLSDRKSKTVGQWSHELSVLLGIFFFSIVVINVGYAFGGSFQRLGEFQFHSTLFSGIVPEANGPHCLGNRFAASCLSPVPVPLPANYCLGIDAQRWDFERQLPSYLCGEWRECGWWDYYLYALAIKLPLGTWLLFLLAVGVSVLAEGYSVSWRDEITLLLPAMAILTLVSSQTGFSIHSRYILPMLPFVFVWMSKIGLCLSLQQWKVAGLAGAALCWSVGSSLWCYPHSLSYFNELVGGPKGGHAHLLDSNIAWGQDLFLLKRWYDDHPNARPFSLAYYGLVDPRLAGIEFAVPPIGLTSSKPGGEVASGEIGPLPGWFAIDVNHLHGARVVAADGEGEWRYVAGNGHDLTYFQCFKPVATVGYSICIYHIALDEANGVRRELGLPELPKDQRMP